MAQCASLIGALLALRFALIKKTFSISLLLFLLRSIEKYRKLPYLPCTVGRQ